MKTFLVALLLIGSFQAGFGAPLDSFNVTISLSAEGLPCKDVFTQPDAFVQMYTNDKTTHNENTEMLLLLGETFYVRDNKNPDWSEVFTYTWKRGTGQKWLFKVMDHDVTNADDHIGAAEVNVDSFMESQQGKFKVNLTHGGVLTIRRVAPIAFKLSAKNLPPRDRYIGSNGLSDPYAVLTYRDQAVGDEKEKEFYRTPVLNDNANPSWAEIINFTKYEPSSHQILRVQVFDRDLFSRDELLGEAYINADDLTERRGSVVFPLQRSEGNASIIIRMPHHEENGPTVTTPAEEIILTTEQQRHHHHHRSFISPSSASASSEGSHTYEVGDYDNEIHGDN